MKWVALSYRWTWGTIRKKLRTMWRQLFFDGPGNVRRWFPVIWLDQDWDWVYLVRILRFKLDLMRTHHANDSPLQSYAETVQELTLAIDICDRLLADEYYDRALRVAPKNVTTHELAELEKAADLGSLGKIITHDMMGWWS